ncbi:type II toxin-antitoxin system HicA family toxin [Candidatus Kaiserbacteria bacterium]|nr:type II toxin-antitoxin system HicA family toxin [Candidatus Kaiserbacteria bacterium]
MPKPKRLSGLDIVRILEHFGFAVENQRGSHIKLSRFEGDSKQVLLISNHKELKTGAVVGIFRQAVRYIPESELRRYFYAD